MFKKFELEKVGNLFFLIKTFLILFLVSNVFFIFLSWAHRGPLITQKFTFNTKTIEVYRTYFINTPEIPKNILLGEATYMTLNGGT